MSKRVQKFFALEDGYGRIMPFTIRTRRKDVPRAAEEWSGYPYKKVIAHGYRIVRIVAEVVTP